MSAKSARLSRPAELTVVVVLTYISAIVAIVFGVLLILARYGIPLSDGGVRGFVTIAGAVVVLVGFLLIAVASGIARGDKSARIISTVLLSLSAAVSIISVVTEPTDLWSQLVNAVIAAAAIAVMWTGRAARYFRLTPAQ
jgi:hypothetical protein